MKKTLAYLLALAFVAACSKGSAEQSGAKGGGKGGPGGRPALEFPVEVQRVQTQPVEFAVNAVGSVEAFEIVAVTARVAGVVERVRLIEGQNVRAGETLVEIEPERYRLAVVSAQANLEKLEAARAEAEAGLARREAASAKNPGLIRGEEIETWRTRVRTATAELGQARVSLEQAKLNLRDAFVSAPVSGTIQTRTVQTGQYVQPGVVLATLVQRDPLLLRFQVPEQESRQLRRGLTARFNAGEDDTTYLARITNVGESADPRSRMVTVTAQVNDPQRGRLKPGAFARVVVPVGSTVQAPVIPQTAIRPSERGFLAFVVENDVAKERILQLGLRSASGQVEVRQGLTAGELLVIRGGEALRDGARVKVVP